MEIDGQSLDVIKEKLAEKIARLAEPVDLLALEETGVLKKRGAWYIIFHYEKLPQALTERIISIQYDRSGKLFALKFSKPTKRLLKLANELNGRKSNIVKP